LAAASSGGRLGSRCTARKPLPGRLKQWPASAHRGEGPRQIDRQHKVEEIIVEGAQIGMQDNPGGVRIVDQDVETALGGIDLGGEAFDRTRILRRRDLSTGPEI
jgi:hypothetical protein